MARQRGPVRAKDGFASILALDQQTNKEGGEKEEAKGRERRSLSFPFLLLLPLPSPSRLFIDQERVFKQVQAKAGQRVSVKVSINWP